MKHSVLPPRMRFSVGVYARLAICRKIACSAIRQVSRSVSAVQPVVASAARAGDRVQGPDADLVDHCGLGVPATELD